MLRFDHDTPTVAGEGGPHDLETEAVVDASIAVQAAVGASAVAPIVHDPHAAEVDLDATGTGSVPIGVLEKIGQDAPQRPLGHRRHERSLHGNVDRAAGPREQGDHVDNERVHVDAPSFARHSGRAVGSERRDQAIELLDGIGQALTDVPDGLGVAERGGVIEGPCDRAERRTRATRAATARSRTSGCATWRATTQANKAAAATSASAGTASAVAHWPVNARGSTERRSVTIVTPAGTVAATKTHTAMAVARR
jgi:hypothetical protein